MTCGDCGAQLVEGVCPACAYQQLIDIAPAAGSLGELGRYTLTRRLAAGGMGVVYEAVDPKLKRTVALKVIRGSAFASEGEVSRFTLEAEAAAGLDHANIVPIYEVGVDDGQPFFTMKFIAGKSLADLLKTSSEGKLDAQQAAAILTPIARAVHHAHRRGVLHRDLKPGNILIDDGTGKAWLSDFGLAKVAHRDSGLTRSTDSLGTPNYMAPELAEGSAGDVSTASDVWALGVMLWEVLTGAPPFTGAHPVETMRRIVENEPARPTAADRDLITLAQRCLEKDPARRPASADLVADELERWSRGEPLQVRRITPAERATKWVRRNPAWTALVAGLVLALLAGGTSSLLSWRRAERTVDALTESLSASRSVELAHESRLQIGTDPQLALLLAVESLEEYERGGSGEASVLDRSSEALYEALNKVGARDVSAAAASTTGSHNNRFPATISPDGRWVLTFDRYREGKGLTAAVFDLHNHQSEPVRRWQIWDSLGGFARNVARWSHDSRSIIAAGHEGEIRRWHPFDGGAETPSYQTVGTLSSADGSLRRYIFHPDNGDWLITAIKWVRGAKELQLQRFAIGDNGIELVDLVPVSGATSPTDRHRLSRDGRWLVGTMEGKAVLADLTAQEGEKLVPIPAIVPAGAPIKVSADSRWIAVRAYQGRILLYDLHKGDLDTIVAARKMTEPLPFVAARLTFSPDGEQLIASGWHRQLFVMSTSDSAPAKHGKLVWDEEGAVFAPAFSNDGRWFGVAFGSEVVKVWPTGSLEEGRPPIEFRGMQSRITNVSFAPDGRSIVASGNNGTACAWPFPGSGANPRVQPIPDERILDIALSNDREWIAITTLDSKCRGILSQSYARELFGGVHIKRIDDDGPFLPLGTHRGQANCVAFSADDKWLASIGVDAVVQVWDVANKTTPRLAHRFQIKGTRKSERLQLDIHPRGELYATGARGQVLRWNLDAPDPASTRESINLHCPPGAIGEVRTSKDGRWLAVSRAGSDATGNVALLFDVSRSGEPKPVAKLPANFDSEANFAFSRDSRYLAGSGGFGKAPTVWDLSAEDIDATRRQSPITSDWRTMAIAFSPDSRWLAIGDTDSELHLWEWRSGNVRTLERKNSFWTAAWLDDTTLLTSNLRGLATWETDLSQLKALAREIAGRELTTAERERFLSDLGVVK